MKHIFLLALCLLSAATTFAQTETFTEETLLKLKRLSGTLVSPDEKWAFYQTTSYDVATNKGTTTGFLMEIATGKSKIVFPAGSSFWNVMWHNNGLIWLRSAGEGTELVSLSKFPLTTVDDLSTEQPTVKAKFDGEVEGLVISADGLHIAALQPVKVNPTIQDKYPELTKTSARLESDLMYRHWNQWQGEKALHLFLYEKSDNGYTQKQDLLSGDQFAAVTPPFGGIDDVCFSADGKSIYYSTKKKTGKDFALSTNSDIYWYSITTGFTYSVSDKHAGYDTAPRATADGKYLTYLSMERNGLEADKNNLILHEIAGGKEKNLTAGLDLTVESYVWSKDGKAIFFTAAKNGTKQVFEVVIATGKIRQITTERCDILSIQPIKSKLIVERQSMIAPTDLWEVEIKTGKQKQITTINNDIMSKIALPQVQEKWLTTTDGKKMLVWMILPPNFDANKKYPSLLYCQGGPQSPVSQYFSYRWNFLLMASHGYVVMAPNRRGLPGFGQEWNDAISKDWGGQAMRDYLVTVDSLTALPFMDKSRVGAVGASYGGYSVYYLAGIHENRFKTFVSHCGLFNLESWYGTTEELFFANSDIGGPYWLPENKELYRKNSPHLMVDKWNTPMLVIHGGKDFRVPESEGMQAFQVLQLKSIPSKFLYFPDEGHWITKPQNSIVWNRTFFEWLDSYLK